MPQATNIVLTDGTTPATFTPKTIRPGAESTFQDMSLGSKALASYMTVSNRDGGNDSTVVRIKLDIPHTASSVDTGITEVLETSFVDIRIRHAAIASEAERDYLVALAQNLLDPLQLTVGPVLRGSDSIY